MGRNLADRTQPAYQHHWESFFSLCILNNASELPATPITVVCYIGHLYGKGTGSRGSISSNKAAIASQHRRFWLSDTMKDPLVTVTHQAYI